jgi:hypothetical protein
MTVKTGSSPSQDMLSEQALPSELPGHSSHQVNLAGRYGAIGITAVAAAVRYAVDAKAGTPAAAQIDQRFIEVAV